MTARREKRKLAKNPPVTKYNLDPNTPIHRQSLATVPAPAMVETKQPKSTPQLHYAILDQPQRSELPLNRNKSEHKGQSDWMVPFCHNPVGDHETAFTGIFAPCVLYGKTHWRLKNVSLGRDPHEFKSSDSCNSMCWIHGALTVACCLSIGLTVIQRARIRAQYRIQGSMGNDIVKSSFCGPCAMMQHDREVRAREGDVGLAKDFGGPQMSQIQPKAPQPMRYALPRRTSAEDPGVEDRIFKQGQRRYTDSELQEVPAVAVSCTEDAGCQISNGHRSDNCEVEALKDHLLMESYRRAINSSTAGTNVAKVDGATSSQQKTRVGSEKKSLDTDSPIPSLYEHHLKVKGCEKLSRMPARGHLSYVHDFSDYSATKIVLDHYAEEERRLQEKGIVRCLTRFSKEKLNQLGSNNVATQSIRSSSSSTIRQHTSQEAAVETPALDLVNRPRTDRCAAESVDAAWLLDIPAQHRISSCSVTPKETASVPKSPGQHRIVSCPTTSGTPVTGSSASSTSKDCSLQCTVETASPSSSSSSAMHNEVSATIMEDSDLSTPLIQYSQYGHLLDENTLKSDSPIYGSLSRCRASSCTTLSPNVAREQHSLEGCSALSGDSSPISVKQHRTSSCHASIPSGSSKSPYWENDPQLLGDCSFTTGSSTPLPTKQQIFASYTAENSSIGQKSSSAMGHLMEDGCLLSGAASPIKQHRVASCGGNVSGQNYINENSYISSGSTTPKLRQHRVVSCIASSAISECEEHLLDDCEFDSKIASPLPQHNITGCNTASVLAKEQGHLLTVFEEEQQHLLEDCAADSSPSSPLRQHRIASCVISDASSNRNSVVKQHRVASCPDIILKEGSGSQSASPDSHRLPRGTLVNTSENDQSAHTNYEDCLHTLDECITPADRVKMEANASRDTEYEKYSMKIASHFNDQATELNEKSATGKEVRRPRLNDFASHESDAQFTLAQVLSLDQENPMISVTQIDGDGTMSVASRASVAPPVPFPSPAAPYPSPITPLHISGAYPPSIPSLSNKKDKRRIPSEQSSAGSAFASYFGFGNTKKTQGLVTGVGGSRRKVNRSRVRSLGLGIVEPVSMEEELELEEILS